MQYSTITTGKCEVWEGLEDEAQADEKLKTIVQELLADSYSHKGCKLKKRQKTKLFYQRIHLGYFGSYKNCMTQLLGDTLGSLELTKGLQGWCIGKACEKESKGIYKLVKCVCRINIKL